MTEFEDLRDVPAVDLMRFLAEQGPGEAAFAPTDVTVAYHDACHASRAQQIRAEPRAVLGWIPGLRTVEIGDGDRCCGAAGIYNVTQPELSGALRSEKAGAAVASGASIVASANPGCSMQIAAGLTASGAEVAVLHPVQLLERALDR